MSANKNSQPTLLGLPREIRNVIYSFVGSTHYITSSNPPSTKGDNEPAKAAGSLHIRLSNSPSTNLLLSCKQISQEYSEEWLQELSAVIATSGPLSSSRLHFKAGFPEQVLASIKRCNVWASMEPLWPQFAPQQVLDDFFLLSRAMTTEEKLMRSQFALTPSQCKSDQSNLLRYYQSNIRCRRRHRACILHQLPHGEVQYKS